MKHRILVDLKSKQTVFYGVHDNVLGIYGHDDSAQYTSNTIARLLDQAYAQGQSDKAAEIRRALQVDLWGR